MEWSTIWEAVGSVATVVGAGGIGFAVYQLRFDAWLKAQEVFTSDEFVKARTAIFAHFDDPVQPWPDPHSEDAKKVCRKMDEMAHLLPFVGRQKMLRGWSNPIAKAWLLLEPTVNEDRRTSHWDEKWKAFAELGAEAVRRNPQVVELRRKVPPNTPLQPTAEKRGG